MKIQIIGKPGEGKSTIAFAITNYLHQLGIDVSFFEEEEPKSYFAQKEQQKRLERLKYRTSIEVRTALSHDKD